MAKLVFAMNQSLDGYVDHQEFAPDPPLFRHFIDFAAAWRAQPKWVVSRSLKSVGPNATLVEEDIEAVIRGLKDELAGEIEVGGPDLARSLTELGLIDEYRLYFRPVVFGHGKPFFAGPGRRSALWPTT